MDRRAFLKTVGTSGAVIALIGFTGQDLFQPDSKTMIELAYAAAMDTPRRAPIWTENMAITAENLNGMYGHTHLVELPNGRLVETSPGVIEDITYA